MIDVPIEVKDALRDGRLKKNYRIKVLYDQAPPEVLENLKNYAWTPVSKSGTYRFISPDPNIDIGIRIGMSGGGYWPADPTATEFYKDFYVEAGTNVMAYSSDLDQGDAFMEFQFNPELFTLDNNNLVMESISIDERMNSGTKIKFGLSEGSSIEFQYLGYPTILGKSLQVFIDADYEIMRLVYETALKFVRGQGVTITEDGNYRIYSETPEAFVFAYLTRDGEMQIIQPTSTEDGTEAILDLLTGDVLDIGWIGTSTPDVYLQKQVTKKLIETYTIPMGFFGVQKCSRQASTGIIRATAYNKILSEYLDVKANDMIISEYDDPSQPITFFDIRKNLLAEYEIQEVTEDIYPMTYGGMRRFIDVPGIGFKFTNYVAMSPINPYQYVDQSVRPYPQLPALSTTKYITWKSHTLNFEYGIQSTDLFRILSDINFTEFETNLYNYIIDLVDSAELSISGQQFMNTLLAKGWSNYVFSIGLYKRENGSVVFEHYSDLGMIYDTAHTTGSITDLLNRSLLGYYKIEIIVPAGLAFTDRSDGSAFRNSITFEPTPSDHNYKYIIEYNSRTDYFIWSYPFPALYTDDLQRNLYDVLSLFKLSVIQNESPADRIQVIPDEMPEITLREAISASYETQCKYGQIDRATALFRGVDLNHSRLYPHEILYPNDELPPDGAQASATKSMYSKLWADEGNVHKWRNLLITYKGLDEQQQEKDFVYEAEINADGTDDYECSDNWIFRNLVWTEAQIEEYADAMVVKMQDMTWFPFEMWCAGLPYLETGDEIEIPLGENSYTSYVLQRQLKGIQNLQDTYINGNLDIF